MSSRAAAVDGVQRASETGATCPSLYIDRFVSAFAESSALQERYSAANVDIAIVDDTAEPEPREMVRPYPRDELQFPIMPNRAEQIAQGLRYRVISVDAERAVIALEVPDTDAQSIYTFRRGDCWTLIKMVNPARGRGNRGVSASPGIGDSETASVSHGDFLAVPGLSATFALCMQRAGAQTIARADCLSDERDRQTARLDRAYRQLLSDLEGDHRVRLVEAQRTWAQLQHKDGAFEAALFDKLGSIGNLQSVENEARAMAQRADQIERYLQLSRL